MKSLDIVNVWDFAGAGEPFLDIEKLDGRPVRWRLVSGTPRNALERAVERPKLSRYRAALEAAREARGAGTIISHLPRMTAATADATRLFGGKTPHLAFSFNFTELPSGWSRKRMAAAFARVDRFCVYTGFEAELYSETFGIDRTRFRTTLWTQSPPPTGAPGIALERPFVAAVGGEGRDFATLIATARRLPDLDFVVIARPSSALADPPKNVRVLCNIPATACWGIASRSDLLLVPLLGPETCCGHITLVSGRQLGLPIVTTQSCGTREYTEGFAATWTTEAGDADALANTITSVRADLLSARAQAKEDQLIARDLYDRARWHDYVADFLREMAEWRG